MKKLILIFGVFAIVCVIISQYTQPSTHTQQQPSTQIETHSENPAIPYMVKSENGRIVVYRNDELLYKTSTAVSTLPKKDQKTLLYGISAQSREEVEIILQQFCS